MSIVCYNASMAKLVLVRHGLSEYNKLGIWSGWENPSLAPEGFEQAKTTADQLKDIHFDVAFTSAQTRCVQTLNTIKEVLGQEDLPTKETMAIRERNYGDYNKKNKWEVKEQIGEEEFEKLRRGWDYPPPNGESLKMVYDRAVPYYETEILPELKIGKNVLVSSSGNALRALVKYLENIPDEKVADLEIGTGEAYVYEINESGEVVGKEIRGENENRGKV